MDLSRKLMDAIADVGRCRVGAQSYERVAEAAAQQWLQSLDVDGPPPSRAVALADLSGTAAALLDLSAGPRLAGLLGRVLSRLVALERAGEDRAAVVRRLLDPSCAERAAAQRPRVLVVVPATTATQVSLFEGLTRVGHAALHVSLDEADGVEPRAAAVEHWLGEQGLAIHDLEAVACRCGFVQPVPPGVYPVGPDLLADLQRPRVEHVSNLGPPLAERLARAARGPNAPLAVTRDPVVCDELRAAGRVTGYARLRRDGTAAHYLNHRAVWSLLASLLGRRADQVAGVAAHVGGGSSVVRHLDGRIPAVLDAFAGIPSGHRAGALDLGRLLPELKAGTINIKELEAAVVHEGGLLSLTGTNDLRALSAFAQHGATPQQRRKIDLVLDFLAERVSAGLLSLTGDGGPVDLIAVTGGLAHSEDLMSRVQRLLGGRYPLVSVPGGLEHESLVAGALQALYAPERLADYVGARDGLRELRQTEDSVAAVPIFARPVLYRRRGSPIRSLDELIDATCLEVKDHAPPRVGIVGANNEEAILAAKRANEAGQYRLAKFSLIGDFAAINEVAYDFDLVIDNDNYEIVDSEDPVADSVRLLHEGHLNILMKGSMKTAQILRGVFKYLKSSGRLGSGELISHVVVADIPVRNKLLLVTDAAVNPYPTVEQRIQIAENGLKVAACLNIPRPKVAVISAIESVNRSVESSIEAQQIAAHFAGREDCLVEGPLSFDVAMDPGCAEEKRYAGDIRGTADVLLMPDIDAGNVLYKTLTTQSKATVAGVILCGDMPMVLTSRGDSARSKLASISLAVKLYFDLAKAAALRRAGE